MGARAACSARPGAFQDVARRSVLAIFERISSHAANDSVAIARDFLPYQPSAHCEIEDCLSYRPRPWPVCRLLSNAARRSRIQYGQTRAMPDAPQ